jgi:hypothetical protein
MRQEPQKAKARICAKSLRRPRHGMRQEPLKAKARITDMRQECL